MAGFKLRIFARKDGAVTTTYHLQYMVKLLGLYVSSSDHVLNVICSFL